MRAFEKAFDEFDYALGIDPDLRRERDAALVALGPRPPWWRMFSRRKWEMARDRVMCMDISRVSAMLRKLYHREFAETCAAREHAWFRMRMLKR